MKIIPTTYTFDKTAKTIDCSNFTAIELISLITNVTTNEVIYQFNSASKWGSLSGTTLTLDYDTSAMSNTDKLQIILNSTDISPITDTELRATPVPISVSSLPLPTDASQDGVDGASITPPTGWSGIRGWLSGIYDSLFLATDKTWSATITTNTTSGASITLNGHGSAVFQLTGTWVGTLQIQLSVNWTNFVNIANNTSIFNESTGAYTSAGNITANGAYRVNCSGYLVARIITTAFTSWSIVVTSRASQSSGTITLSGNANTVVASALPAGTNAIWDMAIQYRTNATGASSSASILSPLTPVWASIKASAWRILGWQLINTAATLRSVKIFNATTVTMGTTTASFEIDIPAGGIRELHFPWGVAMTTGIMWSVTAWKWLTDNTTTGLAVNDVSWSIQFA